MDTLKGQEESEEANSFCMFLFKLKRVLRSHFEAGEVLNCCLVSRTLSFQVDFMC